MSALNPYAVTPERRTDSKPFRRRFVRKTGFGSCRRKYLQKYFRQSFESSPGVQRVATLDLLETWSPCSRPFAILPVSAVSDAQKLATGNFLCVRAESFSLPGRHAPRAFCAAIGGFSRRLCRLFCCLRQPTAACGGFYRRLQSRRRTSYSVRYKMFPKRMLSSKTRCLTMSRAARVCAKNAGYSFASKYAIAGRYVSKNDRLAACSRPKHK